MSFSSAMAAGLLATLVAAGGMAAVFALYLMTVSIAAMFYSEPEDSGEPRARLVVLVPAHNESDLIPRCVRSLRSQTYPQDLYKVVVVADNCTDDTADTAAQAGADLVLQRAEPGARGKGRALRWAMDRLLAIEPAAAAFVVVDADCFAGQDFLRKLVRPFEAGALAVQGESLLYSNPSAGAKLRVSAFLLINRTRPAGRAALGLPMSHLAGNGMLLARELLVAKPWQAFTSAEDLEYSLYLRVAGIKIAFAGGAVLMSPAAPTARAATEQLLRWEGGKIHLARTILPGLIRRAFRRRNVALLGVAFDLALPPLGFLTASTLGGALGVGGLAAAGLLPFWALFPWLTALGAIAMHVLVGLRAAHAPRSAYVALLHAPLFVLTRPLGAHRVLSFRGDTWVRTEREPATPPSELRSEI